MRVNLDLNNTVLEEAIKLSGLKTKKQVVNLALQVYLKELKRKDLSALKGKIKFYPDYSPKKLRD
jgi:Arc/MetJ family transcription regulator